MKLKDIIKYGFKEVDSSKWIDNTLHTLMIKRIQSDKNYNPTYVIRLDESRRQESLECDPKELHFLLSTHLTHHRKVTFSETWMKSRGFELITLNEYVLSTDKDVKVISVESGCECYGSLNLYCNSEGKEFLENLIK